MSTESGSASHTWSSQTFTPSRRTVGGVGRCQFGRSFQQTFSCARSRCGEDSDKRHEWLWRRSTMECWVMTLSWRPEVGNCSSCCPSCCSGDLVATPKWARTSCFEGLTSSPQGSELICCWRGTSPVLKEWRRPALGRTPSIAEQRQLAKRSNWGRFPEQGSALWGRLLLQGQRPRANFSRQDDLSEGVARSSPVTVDRKIFLKCLKSAPRGASPGPGGSIYEHLKTLLDDTDTMEFLFEAITSLARANVPVEIAEVLMGAR